MVDMVKERDDPNRCQAIHSGGDQCMNVKNPGSDFCLVHGGNRAPQEAERQALKNYRLNKFRARLGQLSTSPDIKSLRDEIAILRIMLEERINQCNDAMDMILQSGPISDMVMKIEKVVTSCHKLEGSMKQLVDKQAILQFAEQIIGVISSEDLDADVLDRIGNSILALVGEIGKDEEE